MRDGAIVAGIAAGVLVAVFAMFGGGAMVAATDSPTPTPTGGTSG